MEQYVGKFHFWLKLCEIPLAKMAEDIHSDLAPHNVH